MGSVKERSGIEQLRTALRRAAFEALYGPFAWAYDWVSSTFFLGQWRVWQRASLRFLAGTKILEVGMGTGNLQLDLSRAGYQAWGVDLSPRMLSQAARKARRLRVPPFRACRARAQALPFPDKAFDSVVSTFPSDYIAQPETLREIKRVLRPGGRLVVVPAGWLNPRRTGGRMLGQIAKLVYGKQAAPTASTESIPRRIQEAGWVGTLQERMTEANFDASVQLVSNKSGAALVLIGQLANSG